VNREGFSTTKDTKDTKVTKDFWYFVFFVTFVLQNQLLRGVTFGTIRR